MKVLLLALSLLLFLDSVFSQQLYINCNALGRCPDGYTPQYSGRNGVNAVCQCKRKPEEASHCSQLVLSCKTKSAQACSDLESDCSPKEILSFCNNYAFSISKICDRANQRLREEKYAKTQRTCEFFRDKCNRILGDHCITAARTCDPDTTIQLCKNKRMPLDYICEEAEIQKEKNRAEDAKYSCEYAKKRCIDVNSSHDCSDIAKFCDVETAAKWCYKDDTREINYISDEICSKVIKKSQYFMFGQSYEECWKQVSLCEGGNSEACMQVPTFCVKEVVSALCNANKITNRRICTFAGLEETTSSSYPGCNFFANKCNNREDNYCQLASRYCDNDTIDDLCREVDIRDPYICRRVPSGHFGDPFTVSSDRPDIRTIQFPDDF